MVLCGINCLTFAALLSLHLLRRPPGRSVRKPLHKAGQLHQVDSTHQRPSVAHDNFRVQAHEIGPLRRNRPYGSAVSLQQETFAVSVVSFADAGKLSSEQWVKWMRHPHKLQRRIRRVCILS